jgi:hypothetical protein
MRLYSAGKAPIARTFLRNAQSKVVFSPKRPGLGGDHRLDVAAGRLSDPHEVMPKERHPRPVHALHLLADPQQAPARVNVTALGTGNAVEGPLQVSRRDDRVNLLRNLNFLESLKPQLLAAQVIIKALPFHQVFVRSLLHELALFQHQDQVRVPDRA